MINSQSVTAVWYYLCCICYLLLSELMFMFYMVLFTIQMLLTNSEKKSEQYSKTTLASLKKTRKKEITQKANHVSKNCKRRGNKHKASKIFETNRTTTTYHPMGKPDAGTIAETNQPSTNPHDLIGKSDNESLPSNSTASQQPAAKLNIRTKTDAADKLDPDAMPKSDYPNTTQCQPESDTGVDTEAATKKLFWEGESETDVVSEDIVEHFIERTSDDQVAGKGCEPHLLQAPKYDQVIGEPISNQDRKEDYSDCKQMKSVSNKKQRKDIAFKKRNKGHHLMSERDKKKYDEFVCNSREFLFECHNVRVTGNMHVYMLYDNNNQPSQQYMHYEWNRLISFTRYQGNGNSIRLARNGFYHFTRNGLSYIMCYFCQMILNRVDDADAAHPNCPLFSGTSMNIPIHRQNRGHNGSRRNREVTIDLRWKIVDLGGLPPPALLDGPMVDVHNNEPSSQPNCRVVRRASHNAGVQMPPTRNRKCIVCKEREAMNRRYDRYCCCNECRQQCPIC